MLPAAVIFRRTVLLSVSSECPLPMFSAARLLLWLLRSCLEDFFILIIIEVGYGVRRWHEKGKNDSVQAGKEILMKMEGGLGDPVPDLKKQQLTVVKKQGKKEDEEKQEGLVKEMTH